jgi:hypothetical protein
VVSGEWFIVLMLYCSHIVAVCLHALQVLTALPSRTSYRPMITLMSGVLETCVRALGIYVPSCTGRSARLFFMFEVSSPQGTAGHVAISEPTSAGR